MLQRCSKRFLIKTQIDGSKLQTKIGNSLKNNANAVFRRNPANLTTNLIYK